MKGRNSSRLKEVPAVNETAGAVGKFNLMVGMQVENYAGNSLFDNASTGMSDPELLYSLECWADWWVPGWGCDGVLVYFSRSKIL